MLEPLRPAYPKTEPLRKVAQARLSLRRALRLAWLLPALLGLFVAKDALSIWLYPQRVQPTCQADTLLVMGAAQYNGVPSPAFQRRLDKAYELFENGCASQIVVTGGKQQGDTYTEGVSGVRYLSEKGVPEAALHSETTSTTSYQNLENSRDLVPDAQVTIVTDDLHAYRTRWLAKRLGYAAELAPVFAPSSRIAYALRELRILMAYHLGVVR